MKKLLTLSLLLLTTLTISGCTGNEKPLPEGYIFEILGEQTVEIGLENTYIESGFIARYEFQDISEYVTITSSVNTNELGTYSITYELNHNGEKQTLTRTVIVSYDNIYCQNVTNTSGNDSGYDKCIITWSSYLNTSVVLTMYVSDDSSINLQTVTNNVQDILALYTIISDKYTEYEYMTNIWTINQSPEDTHIINEDLFNLIEFTLQEQIPVVDFYNAALEPVLEIWHDARDLCTIQDTCVVPDQETLDLRNQYTDPANIVLDRENLTITMQENMGLDLGGVSKGYVSKLVIDYLNTVGIYGYIFNNGQSNVSVGGANPRTTDGSFVIAITDPTDPYDFTGKHGFAHATLRDGDQLVTSGDYQKFFEVEGVKYHHIISPITLTPLTHSKSVSIITSDPALADLYSTAIFNMTYEEGLAFVNSIDGLEAIWYLEDGTIEMTVEFDAEIQ